MKKGILTLIFTLIFFMAAAGFGKNLQLSQQNTSLTAQTEITAPLDAGR